MPALVRNQRPATEDDKRVAFQMLCLDSNLYNKQTAPLAVHAVRGRYGGAGRFKSPHFGPNLLANKHQRSGKRHSPGIATVSVPYSHSFAKISRWHPLFPLSVCRSQPCTLVLLVFSSPCCRCERSCTVVARARRLTSGIKTYQQLLSFRALSG